MAPGRVLPLWRDANLSGFICFIDWKAIYTPKDFESGANKNKKSIKIKALIDCDEPLGVGQTLVTKLQGGQA